jgi:hypothetical protein
MSATTNLLDAALALAFGGIPVFPVADNKRPCCDGGYKAATTDPDTIARLFADPRARYVAMPCGPLSGFDAIDIDVKRGGLEWLAENEHRLPRTRRHHTRSAGVHLLLQHSPGMRTKFDRIAPGVEVRGEGGYIVRWDAHGLHCEYRPVAPWPEWLLVLALRGTRNPNAAAPAPKELAPPSAADLLDLLTVMPNPESVTRGEYVGLNLAVAGCLRALDALGTLEQDDADDIRLAAADWCARWDSTRAQDAETELSRWESDWSTRTNDISGWRHVLRFAERLGVDTSKYWLAEAVSEFGEIPDEPDAPADKQAATPAVRVRIDVRPDNTSEQIDAAEAALISAGFGLYQRGGMIVRVGQTVERSRTGATRPLYRMVEVDESHLRELIERCAEFYRFDARTKEDVRTRCPSDLPRTYIARRSIGWKLPQLNGIVTAPTLRHDCSILQTPGYDETSGLFLDLRGASFPAIQEKPALNDARAALADLADLLTEFPFVDDASRSTALSAILTALVRRSLVAAPMHAVSAPAPGTGKGYLVNISAQIATGENAAGFTYSADEAENRKQIDAALLAGAPFLILDNVEAEIQGARLNQLLTEERATVRVLGASKNVEVTCDAFVMANGNNLVVAADMTRRTLLCRMDAKCERPENREFKSNPLARVSQERGRFVAAALTVLRAYHVAGRPLQPKPFASFEQWSGLVRGALLWLGQADPVATVEAVRANDPKRADLLTVMEQWAQHVGPDSVTLRQAVAAAIMQDDFREALTAVAGVGGAINSKRLGKWLRANVGKIVNCMSFAAVGTRQGVALWQLDGARPRDAADAIDFEAERAKRQQPISATDIEGLTGA